MRNDKQAKSELSSLALHFPFHPFCFVLAKMLLWNSVTLCLGASKCASCILLSCTSK